MVLSKKPNVIYFWCLLFWLFLRCFLERLGTLFCHHFAILEVSEALDATTGKPSVRSTSWEGSQSLWSSKNDEKKGNTYWIVFNGFLLFRVIVLSPFWNFGGFRSSRCHHRKALGEIYKLRRVLEPLELKKHAKNKKYLKTKKHLFFNKKIKM